MSGDEMNPVETPEERAQRLEGELQALRASTATTSATKSKARIVGIGAGIAAAVGSVLPWASIGPFTVNGTSGDGTITLILGLIAAGFALRMPKSSLVVAILGALIAVIGVYDIGNISAQNNDLFQASIGIGLVLTTVAGFALVVAWYMARKERATA